MLAASRKIYSFPVPATGLRTDERDHWDRVEQERTRFLFADDKGSTSGQWQRSWGVRKMLTLNFPLPF